MEVKEKHPALMPDPWRLFRLSALIAIGNCIGRAKWWRSQGQQPEMVVATFLGDTVKIAIQEGKL
jgi:hypothetical protein